MTIISFKKDELLLLTQLIPPDPVFDESTDEIYQRLRDKLRMGRTDGKEPKMPP